ncbi:hypothetical protein [Solibacillus cecembensis]|uniref:hypothetical protein n=1 Tax=Solibacillus cecembensis TaxID=459347 RepID=UPI0007171D08
MDILLGLLNGGLSVIITILPVLVLMVVQFGCIFVFSLIFVKLLPIKIYRSLLVCVALVAFYIWAVPMNLGFHEFFRSMF